MDILKRIRGRLNKEIMKMKCLACNGEGGEYDEVLWYGPGGGPYYKCEYCKGNGEISLFR